MKEMKEIEIDRIIEMAWEDRTPFEAIEIQFKISEKDIIKLMRAKLKKSSFKLWRKRVHSRISQNIFIREILILIGLNVLDNELFLIIKLAKDKLIKSLL